jgi:hypothetical protein
MLIREILTEKTQAQRKREAGTVHDQFFTRPEVAQQFANWVKSHPFYKDVTKIIEPAAGNRDLAKNFPGIKMYDLDPQSPEVSAQDFFQSNHKYQPGFLTVMNPPFGKASDMAIKFFNKAATSSDYIAQIVPRTFRRSGIQDRLAGNFELVDEYILPKGSFYLPSEGPDRKYDVPAVAQIWRRTEKARVKSEIKPLPQGIQFVQPQQANVAFRRKGRNAGEIITQNIEQTNPNSFFYIKATPEMYDKLRSVNWREYGEDVMGARSISQGDIAKALN